MRARVPSTPVDLLVPEGWKAITRDQHLFVLPMSDVDTGLGTEDYVGTAEGSFTFQALQHGGTALLDLAASAWRRYTGGPPTDLAVQRLAGVEAVHFEWTDQMTWIHSWVLEIRRGRARHVLEMQYAYAPGLVPTLGHKRLRELAEAFVTSMAHADPPAASE